MSHLKIITLDTYPLTRTLKIETDKINYNFALLHSGSASGSSTGSFTGSFTGSILGTLIGTASWAQSASNAISAAWAPQAAANTTGSFTGSFTGSILGTSSWAESASNAVSAAWAPGGTSSTGSFTGSFTGSLLGTSSWAESASNAVSAAWAPTNTTGSFTGSFTGSLLGTASWAISASWIPDGLGSKWTGSVSISRASDVSITGSLGISGSLILSGSQTNTGSLRITGSTVSGSVVTFQGSGSNYPIFTIQGSQGELFSVVDSLSGSLFSVNDISGLPVLEAFSDNTVLLGSYQAPALFSTVRYTSISGSNNIYTNLPTASYDGVFIEYTISSASNLRAGSIMAIRRTGSVNYTETTTTEFGSTTGVNFMVRVSGSYLAFTGSFTTANWIVKALIRAI